MLILEQDVKVDLKKIKSDLKELDDKYYSLRERMKKYRWYSYGVQSLILLTSIPLYLNGFIFASIVFFIVGMPFTDEYYEIWKHYKEWKNEQKIL